MSDLALLQTTKESIDKIDYCLKENGLKFWWESIVANHDRNFWFIFSLRSQVRFISYRVWLELGRPTYLLPLSHRSGKSQNLCSWGWFRQCPRMRWIWKRSLFSFPVKLYMGMSPTAGRWDRTASFHRGRKDPTARECDDDCFAWIIGRVKRVVIELSP